MSVTLFHVLYLLTCVFYPATNEFCGCAAFRKFQRQFFHSSLAKILESLKDGMTVPEVVHFPDGHFRKVIYGLGPYIVDYPEQALLACHITQLHCKAAVGQRTATV
jgi:hypothetical protein